MLSLSSFRLSSVSSNISNMSSSTAGDKLDISGRSRLDTHSTIDTLSTSESSAAHFDEDVRLTIESQAALDSVWRDMKKGAYKNAVTLKMTFKTNDPLKRLSKFKNLDNVFCAIGKLPQLQEIVFSESALYMPFVHKLLKRTTQLRTIKFHQCKFLLANSRTTEQFWKAVEQQEHLTVLEILECRAVQDEAASSEITNFGYELPACLQQSSTLRHLKRVVLDDCHVDGANHAAFENMVATKKSLEELEIRPILELDVMSASQRFAQRKLALENFLLVTVPDALAQNESLKKVAIAVDDYLLATVYYEAMTELVTVVRDENETVTDLRVCPTLPSATAAAGYFANWETIGNVMDGVEVFSNNSHDGNSDDIGFHVRRAATAKKVEAPTPTCIDC